MKRLNGNRMRLMLIGFVVAIVMNSGRAKADFVWTQKAEMPVTKYMHSTCVVDGKIYSIGGVGPQWNDLTRVDEYDPTTDTWTRKADIPTARGFTCTNVVNEKIYVIGGNAAAEPISIVEVYDPATDTWTQQTELPTKRNNVTTSVVDGIIYVIGGYMPSISSRTGLVEAYDPTTDTWTQKTSMRGIKTFTSSCVVDGKIYVIGGAWTREVVEAYDPATDTWTTKSPMPTPRYGHDTVVVDGDIYAIGGWYHSINGPIYSTVEVYDPQTDTWTKGVDIPVTTAGLSASVVDGKIYIFGGATATHENDNWIFTSAVYANEPIVDLNGDGIVDSADMCIMVDYWGTDEPLCDIGPMPWGDGIVDVQDLIVLSEHLFEEVNDPTLIAHWPLDEVQGVIAYDEVSVCDGTLTGGPVWQPDGGIVDGALELDGVDDCLVTAFGVNPAEGSFSIVAWIKGGAPGQTVISEPMGADWLAVNAEGKLMTELKSPGRDAAALMSQTVIADGVWHRIGLVWDGSQRMLCVDGVTVAEDTQDGLDASGGGLYIGTGKAMQPGTYFSGLIDDVRIYNRVVSP